MPQLEPPPCTDQRRAPRYYFGGVAELTDLESGQMIVALVRDLSLLGCFVKTTSFQKGAKVKLTITDSGSHFSALGRVANQREDGVGIEFTDLGPIDRAGLEECLADLAETVKLPTRILPSAPVPPSPNVHTSGVLVVDDHNVTRSTIQSFLRLNSVPVCGEAENGKEAALYQNPLFHHSQGRSCIRCPFDGSRRVRHQICGRHRTDSCPEASGSSQILKGASRGVSEFLQRLRSYNRVFLLKRAAAKKERKVLLTA